jgi:alpha-L-fucosidase
LRECQWGALVWDIERGQSARIEPQPWQTCTCLGEWHYDRRIFERHGYKSARSVIHMLADIVSKNGNLLLSVPIRSSGALDPDEREVVEGIASWINVNGECLYGTRPWKVFGEGPAMAAPVPLTAQGFNECKGRTFSADDIRFTAKGRALYVIVLGVPESALSVASLGTRFDLAPERIGSVRLLGSDETVGWNRTPEALSIQPARRPPSDIAVAYKVEWEG